MEISRRKWGWYLTILARKNFKLKMLYFRAGSECSMQRHNFRSEVWCLLSGGGEFYNNGQSSDFNKGEARHVHAHTWHQFKALVRSVVLEVQYGQACEEGDIERK